MTNQNQRLRHTSANSSQNELKQSQRSQNSEPPKQSLPKRARLAPLIQELIQITLRTEQKTDELQEAVSAMMNGQEQIHSGYSKSLQLQALMLKTIQKAANMKG